jgi:hypothetical protein
LLPKDLVRRGYQGKRIGATAITAIGENKNHAQIRILSDFLRY